jgi:photosystem II stability/assembly factor-like uncharacterized protein
MKKLLLLFFFPTFCLAQKWETQTSHTDANFRAVSAVSTDVVWVGGSGGTFLCTTDGGKNWTLGHVPGAETCDFRDVQAIDAQTAYLMSAGPAEQGQARIYKTTNGGQSWTLAYETRESGVFFDAMDFTNAQTGTVMSDPINGKWFILQTQNGGQTWQQISPDKLPALQPGEAAFAASGSSLVMRGSRIWIGSGGSKTGAGRVFFSQNGGHSWGVSRTPIFAGATSGVFGLWFDMSGQRGLAVGGDYKAATAPAITVSITNDGGRTWQIGGATTPSGLREGIGQLADGRMIVVGPSGTSVSHDFGISWQAIDASAFHAISCVDGQCWAVGAKGVIAVLKP